MNIGYLRLGNVVELDLYDGSPSNSGCEQRLGVFKALVERGHKIKIYSRMKDQDKSVLEGISTKKPAGAVVDIDYSWCKDNISYHFGEKPDCDMMWIENGSDNTMFGFGGDRTESYFYHTCKMLNDFEGKCIYHQHGDLPFPFGEQFNEVSAGVSDRNQRLIMHELDVQKGKDWHVITPAEDIPEFIKYYNNNRCRYGDLKINVHNVPLCYDDNTYQKMPLLEKPSVALLYIGMERDANRRKKLEKFYSNHDFKTVVIGRWKRREGINIDYKGEVGRFWETYNFLNDSYATVQIADKSFQKFGLPTARILQAVFSGSLLLADIEIRKMEKYIDHDFRVCERYEVREWVEKVMSMSLQERNELRERQISKFQKWSDVDWEKVLG